MLERWRSELGLDDLDARRARRRTSSASSASSTCSRVPAGAGGRQRARRAPRRRARSAGRATSCDRNVRGCVGSGVCAYGCPTERQAARRRHLRPEGATPPARRTYTGVRARADRAPRPPRDAASRRRRPAAAGCASTPTRVVVAAGTIHTPALLAAQRARRRVGQLGRNLSLHPATAVWALMDEVVDMARGVPQSYFVDEFASDGIMLEGIAGPPDYVAMGAARRRRAPPRADADGYRHDGAVRPDDPRRLARARARASARPPGRALRPLPTRDTARVKRGLEHLAELFWAAGARRVLLADRAPPGAARRRLGAAARPRPARRATSS